MSGSSANPAPTAPGFSSLIFSVSSGTVSAAGVLSTGSSITGAELTLVTVPSSFDSTGTRSDKSRGRSAAQPIAITAHAAAVRIGIYFWIGRSVLRISPRISRSNSLEKTISSAPPGSSAAYAPVSASSSARFKISCIKQSFLSYIGTAFKTAFLQQKPQLFPRALELLFYRFLLLVKHRRDLLYAKLADVKQI